MRELQLVGYTADLLHLVFTDAAEGGGRFKAPIDEDFVATLREVMELVDPETVPLGSLVTGRPPAPVPEAEAEEPGTYEAPVPPDGADGVRGSGPMAGMAAAVAPGSRQGEEPVTDRPRPSKLAPREIQALLRAGQGIRSVAKLADTEERWVRRWLPPIEAERDQVLGEVRSSFVAKSRLGVSAEPIGDAVERNLVAKGLRPDDPTVEWIAARREGDPYWKVTLRYRSRGRAQRATWHYNPETGTLDPRNELAVSIAWTRARRGAARRSASGARQRRPAAPAKKSTSKKSVAKKSTSKKSVAKKSVAKKSVAKKSVAKKSVAKKSTAKKSTAKKSTAKKSTAKKSTAVRPPRTADR